jgi:hypothetical protein
MVLCFYDARALLFSGDLSRYVHMHTIKQRQYEALSNYIARVKKIAFSLKQCGEPMRERSLVHKFVAGLVPAFREAKAVRTSANGCFA